jgi:hypothetical protein
MSEEKVNEAPETQLDDGDLDSVGGGFQIINPIPEPFPFPGDPPGDPVPGDPDPVPFPYPMPGPLPVWPREPPAWPPRAWR